MGGYGGKQETYYIHDVEPERPAGDGRGVCVGILGLEYRVPHRRKTLSRQKLVSTIKERKKKRKRQDSGREWVSAEQAA
jgi:hypothetical protein